MSNYKSIPSKSTEAIHGKTTTESAPVNLDAEKANLPVKETETLKTAIASINGAESIKSGLESIKTATLPVTTQAEDKLKIVELLNATELPNVGTASKVPVVGARTKMEIATEIYKRMTKVKGTTRKEILDEFGALAKLSKAGASTYYQLIKAKVK